MRILIEITDNDNQTVSVKSTPKFSEIMDRMSSDPRHGPSIYYAYEALMAIRRAAKEIDAEVKRQRQ